MTDQVNSPGRVIFQSSFTGRCGLFFFDRQAMKIIGLAAAQMVTDAGVVRLAGIAVGQKISNFHSDRTSNRRSADSMIEVVAFDNEFGKKCKNTELSDSTLSVSLRDNFNIKHSMGLAHIYNKSMGITKAKFLRSRTCFRMPCPKTGELTLFYDAIEITPYEKDFISKNDVGSLVTTDQNVPVGLIICGDKNRAFIAPIERLISKICGSDTTNISLEFSTRNHDEVIEKTKYKFSEIDEDNLDNLFESVTSKMTSIEDTRKNAKDLSFSIFGDKVDHQ